MNVMRAGRVQCPMHRLIAVGLLGSLLIWSTALAQTATIDVTGLLETYLRGDFDGAVAKAAALSDLGPFRLRFVQDSPVWINADTARSEQRAAAAAAFLLELTGVRQETDWGRLQDLIEWTCVQLRSRHPTEFERAWHAASHALAGRARARTWLLGPSARLPHQKPASPPRLKNGEPPPVVHLMHALERYPDDSHFQLSRIVAWTWGRDGEPIRNVRRSEDQEETRRPAHRPPQMEAIVALEPLKAIPAVAAEAWLREGLVHFTVGDYASALRAFEATPPLTSEPALRYLAHFNAGRALERLSRIDDAMREYRRALEIVPGAESATVMLASLQFARDERDDAVALIDGVFNRRPDATDPGRLSGYGSFLRWPALRTAMRNAVSSYTPIPK